MDTKNNKKWEPDPKRPEINTGPRTVLTMY